MLTLLLISMMLFGLHGTQVQAATTTVACSVGGTFTITNNAVSGQNGCTGIATVPAGVTSIGANAFSGASALTAITIPAGVTSIGASAFAGARALTAITIPSGVTSIGASAFSDATSLRSVYFLGNKPTIASDAFSGVTGATAYIRSTATGYPAVGSLMNGLTIAVAG